MTAQKYAACNFLTQNLDCVVQSGAIAFGSAREWRTESLRLPEREIAAQYDIAARSELFA
jgi:hypothetical protein